MALRLLEEFICSAPDGYDACDFVPTDKTKFLQLNSLILTATERAMPPSLTLGIDRSDDELGTPLDHRPSTPPTAHREPKNAHDFPISFAPWVLELGYEDYVSLSNDSRRLRRSPICEYTDRLGAILGKTLAPINFQLDCRQELFYLHSVPRYEPGSVIFTKELQDLTENHDTQSSRRISLARIVDSFVSYPGVQE